MCVCGGGCSVAGSPRPKPSLPSLSCAEQTGACRFPSTSSCTSFLFLQWRQIPLFPSSSHAPCNPPRPLLQEVGLPRVAHLQRALPPAPPLPRPASAGGPRAHASPYLTWTNACRQSQEFRPLTSASSAQGTARETAGRGVGRKEGESTNQQPLPACRSFTFCLWVRSRGPLQLSRDK